MNRPHAVKVLSEMRDIRHRLLRYFLEAMAQRRRATLEIRALSAAINALTEKRTTRRTP